MIDVYIACFAIIAITVAFWLRDKISTYPASVLIGLAVYIAIRVAERH